MQSIDRERPRGIFAELTEGASLSFEGARFLRRHRGLWPLALIPMLFALILVGGAASLFWARLDWIHAAWVDVLPVFEADAWWTWVWVGPGRAIVWLAGWLAVLASFALSVVFGLLAANLASAPFLDLLSQRVEAIESGHDPGTTTGGFGMFLRESLSSFGAELQRLLFLTATGLVLGGLGFVIPGAHLVTGPLLIAVAILFLPLDYAGFALDRRGFSFARRRGWLSENRFLMLGFGGLAFMACMVPGLNLLILPVQVTAGTLLVVRRTPLA